MKHSVRANPNNGSRDRFLNKFKNNPNLPPTGRGPPSVKCKGFTIPSENQMNEFDKYRISYDVDQPLRDILIELNQNGYKTGGSCAGHTAKGYGFITISTYKPDNPFMRIVSNQIANS